MQVPDSPAAIRAPRVWAVANATRVPLLTGCASGFAFGNPTWTPRRRAEAKCLNISPCPQGQVPIPQHSCGFHAVKDWDELARWERVLSGFQTLVIGEVWLWGRVVETERGWRGQYAYPASFLRIGMQRRRRDIDGLLTALRTFYGISEEVAA